MKKLYNSFTHGFDKKTLFAILILASADVFSMSAPYYLKYIIPHIYTYLHITQSQFDQLGAILGFVTLGCQLPGGWLADKISSKKMLTCSLFLTGALTIWWTILVQTGGGNAAMPQLYIIYALWGVSTTLIFWTPLWKLLSQLASKEKQGAVYGVQGSFNGIFGLVVITLGGGIATYLVTKQIGGDIAFAAFAYVLASFLLITGVCTYFWVPERNIKEKLALNFKTFFHSLKSIRVILAAIFVMGMYMFQSVFAYYLKSYIQIIGVSGVVLALLAGFRTYALRMIVSSPFGKWADKRRSYVLVLIWCITIGLIVGTIYMLLPGIGNTVKTLSPGYKLFLEIIMSILFIALGVLSWFMVALRYVQIGEIPTPDNSYATVIAIISFVAFSPDAWFYQMASAIGSHYELPNGGYSQAGLQIIMGIAIGIVFLGLIAGTILHLINTKELKTLGKTDYRWRALNNSNVKEEDTNEESDEEFVDSNNDEEIVVTNEK